MAPKEVNTKNVDSNAENDIEDDIEGEYGIQSFDFYFRRNSHCLVVCFIV